MSQNAQADHLEAGASLTQSVGGFGPRLVDLLSGPVTVGSVTREAAQLVTDGMQR